MLDSLPAPKMTAASLEADIALLQATIEELRSAGHITDDAEKYLRSLKESLSVTRIL